MIRSDPERPASQVVHAFDDEPRGPDAVDARAERDEKAAQILHVGFRGGVAKFRRAHRRRRGEHGVLRPGHGRLIQEDGSAAETRSAEEVAVSDVDGRAERPQCEHVGVQTAAPDEIASGVRELARTQPGEHGAREQHRSANAAGQIRIGDRLRIHARGIEFEHARRCPAALDAETAEEVEQRLDVGDARDVLEPHRLAREERGGENREGGVLVAGRREYAAQLVSALDPIVHRTSSRPFPHPAWPAPRAKVAGGPGGANVAANTVEPHGNQTYTLFP